MATSQHVEVEAAKFLQKLIQESKDEPAKLATKLHVICQHMKTSGKEHSLPYQVISRAMETVINQHGLDIEVLKATRLPSIGGLQIGESTNTRPMDKDAPDNITPPGTSNMPFKGAPIGAWHGGSSSKKKEEAYVGSVNNLGVLKESRPVLSDNEIARQEAINPNKPPVGPSRVGSIGHEFYQGPISQRSGNLFEHESPSSLDTRSANSQEMHDGTKLDKQGRQKETKKASAKRKKAGSTSADTQSGNTHHLDAPSTGSKPKKGKMANKGNPQSHFTGIGGEQTHFNPVQNSVQMEHSVVSSSKGSIFRGNQEQQTFMDRSMDRTQVTNLIPLAPTSKYHQESESSGHSGGGHQKGLIQTRHDTVNPRSVWDQFKAGLPSENAQFSRISPSGVPSGVMGETYMPQQMSDKEAGTTGNDAKSSISDSSSLENKVFGFSGHTSEGTVPNNAGKFWQQRIPHSGQAFGEDSFTRDAELAPGRSPVAINSGISQSITGNSGGSSNVHVDMPGSFGPYSTIKAGFSPLQFNRSPFHGHDLVSKIQKERSTENFTDSQIVGKSKDMMSVQTNVKTLPVEASSGRLAMDSEQGMPQHIKDAGSSISSKGSKVQFGFTSKGEELSAAPCGGKLFEQDGSTSHKLANTDKMTQGSGSQGPQSKDNLDTGKYPISHTPVSSSMPFREHHLKQLRAQCLVFLAFRNGVMPRKLHLDVALGDCYRKEDVDGARGELNEHKGKEVSFREPSGSNEATGVSGKSSDIKEAGRITPSSWSTGISMENKSGSPSSSALLDERKNFVAMRRNSDAEMHIQEAADAQVPSPAAVDPPYSGRTSSKNSYEKDENGQQQVSRLKQNSSILQTKPDITNLRGSGNHNDASMDKLAASMFQQGSVLRRTENPPNQPQTLGYGEKGRNIFTSESSFVQANQRLDRSGDPAFVGGGNCGPDDQRISDNQRQYTSNGCNVVSANDTQVSGNSPSIVSEKSAEQDEEDKSVSVELAPTPKYTTSEKWVLDHQKRKLLQEHNWALKQKKTEERMANCYDKLKKAVSSSEDISAKTKSVIELKKLQLLQLQRRLRSGFVYDFFKPITTDMERLKAVKKHRHGRRIKQLEKFEQKMKEERQKRIRERQKEFFSEIEVHKEKLDDCFKIKRERWKGFNKYVKEYHKKKERIHREKIDRIQREKINLLKNNDVEGYLRMVQDAKSDRVKQLLKETEKYLQKLGSKVQEAKSMARQFEMEMDENRVVPVIEKNEVAVDNEDERDQAEHYLESNEKYYLMAHSIKESIMDQPSSLLGGKLREYQMNGLRWLVSLYNNHLNGILADEMGLGKTVQVIALICYLMEAKNDRGPFLVVVPSSVLSGWVSELSFWAPGIIKIAYAGPPEERRRLFKERIVHQKFNVLLTTYEYLMNKHDRPKLSKIHWHYVIIDEGHRIKNASCKLNADLKHYQSSHRLLLTGTPLQNNLEELWALLNFLLPNIFNSSEDFSQWFNKPFESGADTSPDDALLSEEENLLIINRLHQVLRPFVLRRLKHKVENELPEKIERLVRCEASAYQKLLMKRVEDNLGRIGNSKGRAVHNSVMELRNICNHPYISQLHAEQVDNLIPRHYLPPIVRLCGKLEMLDRLLPKLKATDHRVLFFSTMTRLLDVMEEYLRWKRYNYLRLDGHTSGGDRGALIEEFNRPDSPAFIFLLSIRAGGVGVNLQAADTVIIFDTDWNPQVDLQAQARAHRIGQKRDVLVLRLETVRSVEEQVRAAAEHKLGVANQSITAGFFDNHTSAEDRREYLESLLRECKKEESASVLDDDALNDLLARSESEIDKFEMVDKQRREEELAAWQMLVQGPEKDDIGHPPPMPSRLVTDDDLKEFVKAMQIYEESNAGVKRKNEYLGGLDTQQYGRGKRAREVRSYEDQMTEEEFEKLCEADSPGSPNPREETKASSTTDGSGSEVALDITEQLIPPSQLPPSIPVLSSPPPIPTPAPTSIATLTPTPTPSPLDTVTPTSTPLPTPPTTSHPTIPTQSPTLSLTPIPRPNLELTSIPTPIPGPKVTPTSVPTPPLMAASVTVPQTGSVVSPVKVQEQPPKRGRGRPKRTTSKKSSSAVVLEAPSSTAVSKLDTVSPTASTLISNSTAVADNRDGAVSIKDLSGTVQHELGVVISPGMLAPSSSPVAMQVKGQSRKNQNVSGAPRQRATKQNSGPPVVFPQSGLGTPQSGLETSQSGLCIPSASVLEYDKQKLVRPSGGSSAPIDPPVADPVSRVPTAATVASDSSTKPTSTTGKSKVVNRPPGSTGPTIVTYEVNPVSGLQKLVELVPVHLPIPSFAQEKYTSVIAALDQKETDRSSSIEKPASMEAASSTGTHHLGSVESKQNEGVKVSVMHGGQDHKPDQASAPVISALTQDLIERRNLRMGSMDVTSGKMQNLGSISKVTSHQNSQSACDSFASTPELQSGSTGTNTTQLGPSLVEPVEFPIQEVNLDASNIPIMRSQVMKNQKPSVPASTRRTRSGAEKDKTKVPSSTKRGSRKKDLGSGSMKQSTTGNKRSVIDGTTPGCTAGSLETKSIVNTKEAITMIDVKEVDAKCPRDISPEATSGQPNSAVSVDAKSLQEGFPSTVQGSDATPVERNPVFSEPNKSHLPSLLKEENFSLTAGVSQTHVKSGMPLELSQTGDLSSASSITKVVLESCLTDSKLKDSIVTDEQGTTAPEPIIVDPKKASVVDPDMVSRQESKSVEKSDLLALNKQMASMATTEQENNAPETRNVHPEEACDVYPDIITEAAEHESTTVERSDCLTQSEQQSCSSTALSKSTSTSTLDRKSPCIEADCVKETEVEPQTDIPSSLRHNEARVMNDVSLLKAVSTETQSFHTETSVSVSNNESVPVAHVSGKACIFPDRSTEIKSAEQNLGKETFDRNPVSSITKDASASTPEWNVIVKASEAPIVSGCVESFAGLEQHSSEGLLPEVILSDSLVGASTVCTDIPEEHFVVTDKGNEMLKESQQSAALEVLCTDIPEEHSVVTEKGNEMLKESQQSAALEVLCTDIPEEHSVVTDKGNEMLKESQQSAALEVCGEQIFSSSMSKQDCGADITTKDICFVGSSMPVTLGDNSGDASPMDICATEVLSVDIEKGNGFPEETQQSSAHDVCSSVNTTKQDSGANPTTEDHFVESSKPDELFQDTPNTETVVGNKNDYSGLVQSESALERSLSVPVAVPRDPVNHREVEESSTVSSISTLAPSSELKEESQVLTHIEEPSAISSVSYVVPSEKDGFNSHKDAERNHRDNVLGVPRLDSVPKHVATSNDSEAREEPQALAHIEEASTINDISIIVPSEQSDINSHVNGNCRDSVLGIHGCELEPEHVITSIVSEAKDEPQVVSHVEELSSIIGSISDTIPYEQASLNTHADGDNEDSVPGLHGFQSAPKHVPTSSGSEARDETQAFTCVEELGSVSTTVPIEQDVISHEDNTCENSIPRVHGLVLTPNHAPTENDSEVKEETRVLTRVEEPSTVSSVPTVIPSEHGDINFNGDLDQENSVLGVLGCASEPKQVATSSGSGAKEETQALKLVEEPSTFSSVSKQSDIDSHADPDHEDSVVGVLACELESKQAVKSGAKEADSVSAAVLSVKGDSHSQEDYGHGAYVSTVFECESKSKHVATSNDSEAKEEPQDLPHVVEPSTIYSVLDAAPSAEGFFHSHSDRDHDGPASGLHVCELEPIHVGTSNDAEAKEPQGLTLLGRPPCEVVNSPKTGNDSHTASLQIVVRSEENLHACTEKTEDNVKETGTCKNSVDLDGLNGEIRLDDDSSPGVLGFDGKSDSVGCPIRGYKATDQSNTSTSSSAPCRIPRDDAIHMCSIAKGAVDDSEDSMNLDEAVDSVLRNDSFRPSHAEDSVHPGQVIPGKAEDNGDKSDRVGCLVLGDEASDLSNISQSLLAPCQSPEQILDCSNTQVAVNYSKDPINMEEAAGVGQQESTLCRSHAEHPVHPGQVNPGKAGDSGDNNNSLGSPVLEYKAPDIFNTSPSFSVPCRSPQSDEQIREYFITHGSVNDSKDPVNLEEAAGSGQCDDTMCRSHAELPVHPDLVNPSQAGCGGELSCTALIKAASVQDVAASTSVACTEDELHGHASESTPDQNACPSQDPLNLHTSSGPSSVEIAYPGTSFDDRKLEPCITSVDHETSLSEAGELCCTTLTEAAAVQDVAASSSVACTVDELHGHASESTPDRNACSNQDPLNPQIDGLSPGPSVEIAYPGTSFDDRKLEPCITSVDQGKSLSEAGELCCTTFTEAAAVQDVAASSSVACTVDELHGHASESTPDRNACPNQDPLNPQIDGLSPGPSSVEIVYPGTSFDDRKLEPCITSVDQETSMSEAGELCCTTSNEAAAVQDVASSSVACTVDELHGHASESTPNRNACPNQDSLNSQIDGSTPGPSCVEIAYPGTSFDDRKLEPCIPSVEKETSLSEAGELCCTALTKAAAVQDVAVSTSIACTEDELHGHASESTPDRNACPNQDPLNPQIDGTNPGPPSLEIAYPGTSFDDRKLEPCMPAMDRETSLSEAGDLSCTALTNAAAVQDVTASTRVACTEDELHRHASQSTPDQNVCPNHDPLNPQIDDTSPGPCSVEIACPGTSFDDRKFEPCIPSVDQETSLSEAGPSVSVEPSTKPLQEEFCEVKPLEFVESGQNHNDENQSEVRNQPETELSPQQVLADLSDDHKDETPSFSEIVKEDQMDEIVKEDQMDASETNEVKAKESAQTASPAPSTAMEKDGIISEEVPPGSLELASIPEGIGGDQKAEEL